MGRFFVGFLSGSSLLKELWLGNGCLVGLWDVTSTQMMSLSALKPTNSLDISFQGKR